MHILGNNIGAEGACALAESLKQNITLTQLNLERKCVAVFNVGDEIQLTCAYSVRKPNWCSGCLCSG